jgi:parvulin-like peptidyl-prolyl isomerase
MVFSALLALLVAALPAGPRPVAHRADGRVITEDEVNLLAAAYEVTPRRPATAALDLPPGEERQLAREVTLQLIEQILLREAYAPRLAESGAQVSPTMLAEAEAEYRRCQEAAFRATLLDPVTPLVRADLEAAYERFRHDHIAPEQREVSYIYAATTADMATEAREAKRQRLEQVRAAILAGRLSFREAARAHSEAPSAKDGGGLGAIPSDTRMRPEFRDLIFRTPANSLSPVTELSNGFYLVRVGTIIPERNRTLDEALADPAIRRQIEHDAREIRRERALIDLARKHGTGRDLSAAIQREIAAQGMTFPDCTALHDIRRAFLDVRAAFDALHAAEMTVTEAEVAEFHATRPAEVSGSGIFRLRRYLVTAAPGTPISSRDAAMAVAREARAAAEGDGPRGEALVARIGRTRLLSQDAQDWAQSTGHGTADIAFANGNPGDLSDVFMTKEGAVFFELLERRRPPVRPLAEVRGDIIDTLRGTKRAATMAAVCQQLLAQQGVKTVW